MLKELFNEHAESSSIDDFFRNFDHHGAFFRTHYYNILGHLAGRDAVRSDVYDGGFTIVTSHALLLKVATMPDAFSNIAGFRVIPKSTVPPQIPDDLDGVEHEFFRRLLNPYFSPKAIAGFADGVAADIRAILDDAATRGQIDVATELGQPVTGRVTMRILGFPPEDWDLYSLPIHNAAFNIGPFEQRMEEGRAFGRLVSERTAELMERSDAPGLIGHLARSAQDGRRLTVNEVQRIVMNLIIGGLDTTQAVLSCAAVYLARHPDRRQELADHPDRIASAVQEFLRIFASAPMTGRYNIQDLELDGHRFHAGETTMLFWPAGNFDPAYVERPFEVDFTRDKIRNVTFAMGPHRCLGHQLAKMELTAFISALVGLPDFHLVEEGVRIAEDIGSTVAYLHTPISFRHM